MFFATGFKKGLVHFRQENRKKRLCFWEVKVFLGRAISLDVRFP
jgi:hypothetical protein